MKIGVYLSRILLAIVMASALLLQGCASLSLSPKQVAPPETVTAAEGAESVRLESDDGMLLFGQWWLPQAATSPRAVILLAHGTSVHSGFYSRMARHFTEQNIAVFAIDFRGWGQSGGYVRNGVVGDYDEYLLDLRTAYDEVKSRFPETPLFLQGESMGGAIALLSQSDTRLEFDVDGLVLNAPAVRVGLTMGFLRLPHFLNDFGLWALSHPGRVFPNMPLFYPPKLSEKLFVGRLLKEEENQRLFLDDPYSTHTSLPLGYLTELQDATTRVEDNLHKVTVPVVIIQGTSDLLVPVKSSEFAFEHLGSEDKTLKLYEKLTHATLHDRRREEVWRDIVAWIDARLPETAATATEQAVDISTKMSLSMPRADVAPTKAN